MTSERRCGNWLLEAGRGHVSACLSWGGFLIYLVIMLMTLSLDSAYSFFGIGSQGLFLLCGGLGTALGFSEFAFFFQQRKQDFYYSLPVKRDTICWTRYLHGIIHFIVPLTAAVVICALFQAVRDEQFASYVLGYTGRSLLVAYIAFFIFYHITLLAVVVSGRIVTAVLLMVLVLGCGGILVEYVLKGMAGSIFQTFYRIDMLERAKVFLAPAGLLEEMSGSGISGKREVLQYMPDSSVFLAAVLWVLLAGVAAFCAYRGRKTEMTGRTFASVRAERIVEMLASVFAGLCLYTFILKIFPAADMGMGGAVVRAFICCTAGACMAHMLLEWLVQIPGGRLFRRKPQLLGEVVIAFATAAIFLLSAKSYDGLMPEKGEVRRLQISVSGLDVKEWQQNNEGNKGLGIDGYVTDQRLRQYSLQGAGKDEGFVWLWKLKKESKREDGKSDADVTVCYQMKNGADIYRTYPVDKEAVLDFAGVYETKEYKKKAYPLYDEEEVGKNRMVWDDGILKKALSLSVSEKETLLEAYRQDVEELKLEQLINELPAGELSVKLEFSGKSTGGMVYPFFKRTCGFLNAHGVSTASGLKDYPVDSISIMRVRSVSRGAVGGVTMELYEKKEETDEWRNKLIPRELAIQPLLCPVNRKDTVKAEVEETETSSVITVKCYLLR